MRRISLFLPTHSPMFLLVLTGISGIPPFPLIPSDLLSGATLNHPQGCSSVPRNYRLPLKTCVNTRRHAVRYSHSFSRPTPRTQALLLQSWNSTPIINPNPGSNEALNRCFFYLRNRILRTDVCRLLL
ncbi:hypothetical protein B0H34DRAFT_57320 [Crassisporium funariophilum]|nr:hypothetical protein B0H34DRAFT_57320 [Crassisporium funariophilum]